MGDESFNEKILVEKLAKLNNSQQSIESLSKWCVSYRKKAKQVVETWEKALKSTTGERRVSLLYLSNDILQNSRRKGSEFVNEFWKVLPAALKDIYDSGDENCRKVAIRLIDIWEERKVFGSRSQNLKSEIMGHNPAPVNAVRNLNLIKMVKRDANSVRLKLIPGGLPEKIMTAMHTVNEEIAKEERAVDKCRNAISSVQEIDKDAMNASSQGKLNGSDVVDQVQKQEDVIQQSIIQFQKSEENRTALISQLREALQNEESNLEAIRSERLAAQSQLEHAANIKLRVTSASSTPPTANHSTSQQMATNLPPKHSTVMSPPTNSNQEGSKKAAAASMAAKLAASTSSAQVLTSILSSLAAEEAATKRAKTDQPPFSDAKNPSEGSNNPAYYLSSQQMTTNVPVFQPGSSASSQLHAPFLPHPPVVQPIMNQPLQPSMMGIPYNNYGAGNLYPPLPPPSSGFARPGMPPQQAPPPPPPQQQPPGSGAGGYLGGLGVGFYGQGHQPSTPPIHKQ